MTSMNPWPQQHTTRHSCQARPLSLAPTSSFSSAHPWPVVACWWWWWWLWWCCCCCHSPTTYRYWRGTRCCKRWWRKHAPGFCSCSCHSWCCRCSHIGGSDSIWGSRLWSTISPRHVLGCSPWSLGLEHGKQTIVHWQHDGGWLTYSEFKAFAYCDGDLKFFSGKHLWMRKKHENTSQVSRALKTQANRKRRQTEKDREKETTKRDKQIERQRERKKKRERNQRERDSQTEKLHAQKMETQTSNGVIIFTW